MFEIMILLLAGLGAGIVTGLVGGSAVLVAAPLLIVFLDYPAYLAIGIALSIDVVASLFATVIYYKHGRLKINNSMILLVSALAAVLISSAISKDFPANGLSFLSGLGVILTGFLIMLRKKKYLPINKKYRFFKKYEIPSLIAAGIIIGTIAGIFGAGGGIAILLALILILNYETHEAIGTSVFLMMFIAFFGGLAHYMNAQFSVQALVLGSIGGLIGAGWASRFANLLDEKVLNKLVGVLLVILGVLLTAKNIIILF